MSQWYLVKYNSGYTCYPEDVARYYNIVKGPFKDYMDCISNGFVPYSKGEEKDEKTKFPEDKWYLVNIAGTVTCYTGSYLNTTINKFTVLKGPFDDYEACTDGYTEYMREKKGLPQYQSDKWYAVEYAGAKMCYTGDVLNSDITGKYKVIKGPFDTYEDCYKFLYPPTPPTPTIPTIPLPTIPTPPGINWTLILIIIIAVLFLIIILRR